MTNISRGPNSAFEVGGAILAICTYLSFYRTVIEPYIPGDAAVELQVGILGLILLGLIFTLLYLSNIRSISLRRGQ